MVDFGDPESECHSCNRKLPELSSCQCKVVSQVGWRVKYSMFFLDPCPSCLLWTSGFWSHLFTWCVGTILGNYRVFFLIWQLLEASGLTLKFSSWVEKKQMFLSLWYPHICWGECSPCTEARSTLAFVLWFQVGISVKKWFKQATEISENLTVVTQISGENNVLFML